MVLKQLVPGLVAVALVAGGSVALADEYRADEFLGLDLSQAVLSPKRLGPETQFAPVRIEAKTDHAQVEPKPERKVVRSVRAIPAPADVRARRARCRRG